MKYMVLGADGMVGSGVAQSLGKRNAVVGTTRDRCQVGNIDSFKEAILAAAPDVVVNCIGVVPQRCTDPERMIACNALFPHQLRNLWRGKLIHISTDCVWDQNVYGRSKLLGETGMTLRCCVVGHSPKIKVSLLDWFVFNSPDTVDGWVNAFFSPVTNLELGRAIEAAAAHYEEGVHHLCGERMSKFEYLRLVNWEYGLGKTIRPVDEPRIDKSGCDIFRTLTGWRPRSTVEQIRELRA